MKSLSIIVVLSFVLLFQVRAQLTLGECQQKARGNYPLVKQFGLIDQTIRFNMSNANKGYLPQISVSAKASFQSEVTQIPESLGQILSQITGREVSFPTLSRDQYQALIEASQLIWDGGNIAAQKQLTRAGSEVEKNKFEVDLFALNERVNQLFFGVLLIDEQVKQTGLLQSELESNYKRLEALQQNGMANQADLDVLKVEQLNLGQRQTELKSMRGTYLVLLSAFIGQEIPNPAVLVKPETDIPKFSIVEINRPELKLFDAQIGLYDSQKQQLDAALKPRVGAFLQGGYGQPGLNMFEDGFSPFFIGGIRFSWALSAFYSRRNNLSKLELGKQTIEVQRETFLFNTKLKVSQSSSEIEGLKTLLKSDDEIIALRQRIKNTAIAKVENGTLTTTDLVREINAESHARQQKSLHELQLLMAIYSLKNMINN